MQLLGLLSTEEKKKTLIHQFRTVRIELEQEPGYYTYKCIHNIVILQVLQKKTSKERTVRSFMIKSYFCQC